MQEIRQYDRLFEERFTQNVEECAIDRGKFLRRIGMVAFLEEVSLGIYESDSNGRDRDSAPLSLLSVHQLMYTSCIVQLCQANISNR